MTSLVISVGQTKKFPFPFDKIVVPSTALLYPAYKNNNQMHGGLGRVCATRMYCSIGQMKFPKFQTGIFVEWKALKTDMKKKLEKFDNLSITRNKVLRAKSCRSRVELGQSNLQKLGNF